MDNDLTPLLFEGEHLIRALLRNDEPWFVGRDVCRVLHIRNESQALARLDDDERCDGVSITDPIGRAQDMILISEPGVYRLVFTSRRPEAERLKRWLAHDVLPSLRRTGSYSMHQGQEEAAEKRPFPDWPMEELRTKKGVVDMYRLLYGSMAAQWVSPQLGFPSPPVELIEHGRQYTMTMTFRPGEPGEAH
jgi:prophage antirepressor-like protein